MIEKALSSYLYEEARKITPISYRENKIERDIQVLANGAIYGTIALISISEVALRAFCFLIVLGISLALPSERRKEVERQILYPLAEGAKEAFASILKSGVRCWISPSNEASQKSYEDKIDQIVAQLSSFLYPSASR